MSSLNFGCLFVAQTSLRVDKLQDMDESKEVVSKIHQMFTVYLQKIYENISLNILI